MRKNKVITVYENSECHYTILPEEAPEFMAFWQDKLNKIPDDRLNSAVIQVEVKNVEVTYVRPESDDEMESRERQEKWLPARERDL